MVFFPSRRGLVARARGLSEAVLRRHLSALGEAGLMIRRNRSNGKRYARRGEGGQVNHASALTSLRLAHEPAAALRGVHRRSRARLIGRRRV